MSGETISAEQAASLVKSGMWLDYGGCNRQPDVLDKAVGARKNELENVTGSQGMNLSAPITCD